MKKAHYNDRGDVDTSIYTIEERLVSAVWVHERKRMNLSIEEIRKDFAHRFGKEPPSKNTLYIWEKKLFKTGNVMDAKRTGRPCSRRDHIEAVKRSFAETPNMSLRARASRLRLPRTTLIKIIQDDLKLQSTESKAKSVKPSTNGASAKENNKADNCAYSQGDQNIDGKLICPQKEVKNVGEAICNQEPMHNYRPYNPVMESAPAVDYSHCLNYGFNHSLNGNHAHMLLHRQHFGAQHNIHRSMNMQHNDVSHLGVPVMNKDLQCLQNTVNELGNDGLQHNYHPI